MWSTKDLPDDGELDVTMTSSDERGGEKVTSSLSKAGEEVVQKTSLSTIDKKQNNGYVYQLTTLLCIIMNMIPFKFNVSLGVTQHSVF